MVVIFDFLSKIFTLASIGKKELHKSWNWPTIFSKISQCSSFFPTHIGGTNYYLQQSPRVSTRRCRFVPLDQLGSVMKPTFAPLVIFHLLAIYNSLHSESILCSGAPFPQGLVHLLPTHWCTPEAEVMIDRFPSRKIMGIMRQINTTQNVKMPWLLADWLQHGRPPGSAVGIKWCQNCPLFVCDTVRCSFASWLCCLTGSQILYFSDILWRTFFISV